MDKEEQIVEKELFCYCCWCDEPIWEDSGGFTWGIKLAGILDLPDEGGPYHWPISHANKIVPAIVSPKDSPARRDGQDLVFILCSEFCVDSLREAIQKEKEYIRRRYLN